MRWISLVFAAALASPALAAKPDGGGGTQGTLIGLNQALQVAEAGETRLLNFAAALLPAVQRLFEDGSGDGASELAQLDAGGPGE